MRPRSVPSPLPTALAAAENAEPESSVGRSLPVTPLRSGSCVGAPYAGDVAIAFSRSVSFPPLDSTFAVTLGERVEAVGPPPPEDEPPPPDACDPSLVGISSTYWQTAGSTSGPQSARASAAPAANTAAAMTAIAPARLVIG
jgi:hypothetical protein